MKVTLQEAELLMKLNEITPEEFRAYASLKAEAVRTAIYGDNTRNLDYSDLLSENNNNLEPDVKLI